MVVRGARGLARRLLVLADPVAECPGEGQRPAPEEGTIQLPASDRTYEARHVWHDLQRTESPAADIGSNGSCGTRRCVPVPDGVECRRILGFGRRNAVAPKVLDRTFTAYLWTAEGWLYVAAVVDLFSRRVVGWSMHATMTTQLVTDALVIVIWQRGKPAAVLHHSDRGAPPLVNLSRGCWLTMACPVA